MPLGYWRYAIALTELSPLELSLEPIRADALILLESDEIVLHLEFQTQPQIEIPFQMIDYRLRVYRRFPQKQMQQVVIYLRQTTSQLVQQTTFSLERTCHEFQVIRLWEQPTTVSLQFSGLLPFAVLSQTNNRMETLQQVAQEIVKIADQRVQNNVAASFILAGLVLEKDIIQQILRRELMQESTVLRLVKPEPARTSSVTYQALVEEGRAEGRAEGFQQGIDSYAFNLLQEGMSAEVVAKVTGLSLEAVQQLMAGDAL